MQITLHRILLRDTSLAHIDYTVSLRDPARISESQYPLWIFGGKRFCYSDLSNVYYNPSNLASIKVVSRKSFRRVLFGRAGRNGIVIVNLKTKVEWVSSLQIVRQLGYKKGRWRKKIIFKIDDTLVNLQKELYFQKDLIESVEVRVDSYAYYAHRKSGIEINVKVKKGSGR